MVLSFATSVHFQIMLNHETQQSRGFAFITFERAVDCGNVKIGKSHRIDNVVVEVKSAVHKKVSFSCFFF